MFARLGAYVMNADEMVRCMLVEKGPVQKKILRAFPNAADQRGGIDRGKLAQIVFHDVSQLTILEEILHPEVHRRIARELQMLRRAKKWDVVVLDVPLLFESGMDDGVDATVVVQARRDQQIQRVIASRMMTRAQVVARLRRQMPQVEKIRRADFVIDNRDSKAKTRAQVKRIWEGLVQR